MDGTRPTVFVSYAREDDAFLNQLAIELAALNVSVWRDTTALRAGEKWRDAVESAISSAELVVFLLSHESARSPECGWEIAAAVAAGKVVLTVRLAPVGDSDVPAGIGDRQWIIADGLRSARNVADEISRTLWTDFDALRTHTAISAAETEWRTSGRRGSLLRGAALRESERWLATTTDNSIPRPTPGQRAFVIRSRRAARVRAVSLLTVATLLAVAVGGGVVQGLENARRRADAAVSVLLDQADAARSTDPAEALRLAVAAEAVQHTADGEASLLSTLASTHLAHQVMAPGRVETVALNASGTLLAAGGERSGGVLLWQTEDPESPVGLPTLTRVSEPVALLFTDDHILIASGADDTLSVWDVSRPEAPRELDRRLFAETRGVGHPMFRGYDGTFAVVDSEEVTIWRPDSDGHLVSAGRVAAGAVEAVAFSSDGSLVATDDGAGTATLWSLTAAGTASFVARVSSGDSFATGAVAFAPDERTLLMGGGAGVTRWDVSDPTSPRRLGITERLQNANGTVLVPVASTRQVLYADDSGAISRIETPDAPELVVHDTLRAPTGGIESLTVDARGRTAASGARDGSITLWELADRGAPLNAGRMHVANTIGDEIVQMSAEPGGTVLVGDAGGFMTRWDLGDPASPLEISRTLVSPDAAVQSFSQPPGPGLLGIEGFEFEVWTSSEGAWRRLITLSLEGASIERSGFLPGRHILATGTAGGALVLWDLGDPDTVPPPVISPDAQSGSTDSLAVSPDGRTVALGGADDTIALWDVTGSAPVLLEPLLLRPASTPQALVFTADGSTLVSGSLSGNVLLWDTATRAEVQVRSEIPSSAWVTDLALAPDDRTLAIARRADDPRGGVSVEFWDITDRTRPRPLGPPQYRDATRAHLVIPTGQPVLAMSTGPTAEVFDFAPLEQLRVEAVERACRIIGTGLGRQRWSQLLPDVAFQSTC